MIYISSNQRLLNLQAENEALKAYSKELELTSSIVFVKMAENKIIDNTTILEHYSYFTDWDVEITYDKNSIVNYEEALYRAIKTHSSSFDNTPDNTEYWELIGKYNELMLWSKPLSKEDAYKAGDKVLYDGQVYVSIVDENIWEPNTFGWEIESKI